MSYTNIILFLLLCASLLQVLALEKRRCIFTYEYAVHVINKLPPNSAPLKLHCASKDDDLGNHTLPINQDYNWSFCNNIIYDTLFFCRLRWESKEKAFDVFESKWRSKCDTLYCYWMAKDDGIYFSKVDDLRSFTKEYDWDVRHMP
ncbi:hypothetical protein PHJA_001973100 [Phtheirospermum japonicum]|uniref:S-protein homolog n=1 Tax=Phtheirospermum japonicum TaxID=374723 RepID=A0A830CJ65_9LAMI|nr:hypothetical protein PHJA_001973100 [Phtheirospermum japonicum]